MTIQLMTNKLMQELTVLAPPEMAAVIYEETIAAIESEPMKNSWLVPSPGWVSSPRDHCLQEAITQLEDSGDFEVWLSHNSDGVNAQLAQEFGKGIDAGLERCQLADGGAWMQTFMVIHRKEPVAMSDNKTDESKQ